MHLRTFRFLITSGMTFTSDWKDFACKPPQDLVHSEHRWNNLDQRWTPSEELADLLDLPGPNWMMMGMAPSEEESDASSEMYGEEDEEDEEAAEIDADATTQNAGGEPNPGAHEDEGASPVRAGSALEALEQRSAEKTEDEEEEDYRSEEEGREGDAHGDTR